MFKRSFFKPLLLVLLPCTLVASGCSPTSPSGSSDSSSINESTMSLSFFAGVASKVGNLNGTGAAAMFNYPFNSVTDGTNLYVADMYNNLIRKVVISTGVVTTLAGSGEAATVDGTGTAASFSGPTGITTDGTNLYVTEWTGRVVRKIVIATGVVTTLAGTAGVQGSTDAVGTAATFSIPYGIETDGTNLYVLDMWIHKIRKIVIATGAVTTFAGTGSCGSADGIGTAASFCQPGGITSDGTYLYVADTSNQLIRQVEIATGTVTTIAGTAGVYGHVDATGTAAQFNYPEGIAHTGGHLYVMDTQNYVVRDVNISSGVVTTLAGTAGVTGASDGVGTAISFAINPTGITTDGTNLYITDTSNSTIRKIVISTATSSTLVGTGATTVLGSTDGTSSAARFNSVQGMTTDGTNLYVTDQYNHTIRKIVLSTGAVTTLAGSAGLNGTTDATGSAARFDNPYGIVHVGGNLYVADYMNHVIRKIVVSTGVVTTFAGSGVNGHADGTGTAAQFSYPAALATDGTYLYVGGGQYVQKVRISDAEVTSIAGDGTYDYADGTGTAAKFAWITGIAVLNGNLYVTDGEYSNVRKIVISTGVVTTVAGATASNTFGSTDGNGTAARFSWPSGIAVLNESNLYITDQGNNVIRKFNVNSGQVTTVVGQVHARYDREGLVATTATIAHPNCIMYDSSAGLFTANDAGIQRIR